MRGPYRSITADLARNSVLSEVVIPQSNQTNSDNLAALGHLKPFLQRCNASLIYFVLTHRPAIK